MNYPLFDDSPIQRFDTLVLRGGGHDAWSTDWGSGRNTLTESASYMRDEFLRRTETDMGLLSPRGRFVQLYINGEYRGMYNLHERAMKIFMPIILASPQGTSTLSRKVAVSPPETQATGAT